MIDDPLKGGALIIVLLGTIAICAIWIQIWDFDMASSSRAH
jgi:hypothetical protein